MHCKRGFNCLFILGALLALTGCASSGQPPQSEAQPSPAQRPQAEVQPPSVALPLKPVELTMLHLVEDPLDVPYVPTPPDVVARMLEMARVNKDDVVYDLGSGDGRIIVTAAQTYGARGVGYDLDPERIKEANANAQQAGVSGRVRFIQQDLFEADLSEATVVTLYLLPEVNMKLRPKLLRELKPGTRVVSHNYTMGDWEPIVTEAIVRPDTGEHSLFYWVIPERAEPENPEGGDRAGDKE